MECYSGFAEVYDTFMDNVPYEKWCDFICHKLNDYGIQPSRELSGEAIAIKDEIQRQNLNQEFHTVLDLGCGTGNLTELLADRGFDMIGVDFSTEMLQIAMEKNSRREKAGILYLCQDMRELELFGTVGAVVSVCDCINYLVEEADVIETFRKVNNYLFPKGIFIFDFNTVHKYRDVIGDRTIAENREECSFIWENYYHEKEEINQYELTIFVRDDASWEEDVSDEMNEYDDAETDFDDEMTDGAYEETEAIPYLRFHETHFQRGYTLKQMKSFLEEVGLKFMEAIDADTQKQVTQESERICVVARECGKGERDRMNFPKDQIEM